MTYIKKKNLLRTAGLTEGDRDLVFFERVSSTCAKIETVHGRCVVLYETIILKYRFLKYTLNTNGRETVTTKNRINEFLPSIYRIFQKNRVWYVENTLNGKIVEYKDGIQLPG